MVITPKAPTSYLYGAHRSKVERLDGFVERGDRRVAAVELGQLAGRGDRLAVIGRRLFGLRKGGGEDCVRGVPVRVNPRGL